MMKRGASRRDDDGESVEDWMERRNRVAALRGLDAEAAGREAWVDATRSGRDVAAQTPSDLMDLGVDSLERRNPNREGGSREADPYLRKVADRSYITPHEDDNDSIIKDDAKFDIKGYYTVSSHGNDTGFGLPVFGRDNPREQTLFDPKKFADDIRANGWNGTDPIFIMACNVGTQNVARRIAAELGVPVVAATGLTWSKWADIPFSKKGFGVQSTTWDGDGNHGEFREFRPDGSTVIPFGKNEPVRSVVADQDGNLVGTSSIAEPKVPDWLSHPRLPQVPALLGSPTLPRIPDLRFPPSKRPGAT